MIALEQSWTVGNATNQAARNLCWLPDKSSSVFCKSAERRVITPAPQRICFLARKVVAFILSYLVWIHVRVLSDWSDKADLNIFNQSDESRLDRTSPADWWQVHLRRIEHHATLIVHYLASYRLNKSRIDDRRRQDRFALIV